DRDRISAAVARAAVAEQMFGEFHLDPLVAAGANSILKPNCFPSRSDQRPDLAFERRRRFSQGNSCLKMSLRNRLKIEQGRLICFVHRDNPYAWSMCQPL